MSNPNKRLRTTLDKWVDLSPNPAQPDAKIVKPAKNSPRPLAPPRGGYSYDKAKSSGSLANQVKYGPSAQIGKGDMTALMQHYGADVGERLTQYDTAHVKYAQAATLFGHRLTLQEREAASTGMNATAASINHVIASGTGQNMLNRMTLAFHQGRERMRQADLFVPMDTDAPPTGESTPSHAQRERISGIAMQAAAVGRMTSMGRDILAEEHATVGYGKSLTGNDTARRADKRARMVRDVLTSFDGDDSATRMGAYRRYMKHTFDSFGNLRVGISSGNTRVSTGFDMPLDSQSNPTARGTRLLTSLYNFGMPDMLEQGAHANTNYKSGKSTQIRTGVFTTSELGKRLSSSIEH